MNTGCFDCVLIYIKYIIIIGNAHGRNINKIRTGNLRIIIIIGAHRIFISCNVDANIGTAFRAFPQRA